MKKGFTLIEVIISITVFGILAGIVIFGYQDTKRLEGVKQASLTLLDQVRLAQNMTMAGKTTGGEFPIGGYGLHININTGLPKDEYLLFADRAAVTGDNTYCDLIDNQRYDNDPNLTGVKCSNDLMVKKIELPPRVEIVKIEKTEAGVTQEVKLIDLAFRPPKPIPYVGWLPDAANRNPDSENYAKPNISTAIYLKHTERSFCRKVTIIGASSQFEEKRVNCPS